MKGFLQLYSVFKQCAVLITASIYYSMYFTIAFFMLFALLPMWPITLTASAEHQGGGNANTYKALCRA